MQTGYGKSVRKTAALLGLLALMAGFFLEGPVPVQAAHRMPQESFTFVPGTTICMSPGVSAGEAWSATMYYLMLPQNVQERIVSDSVTIYLIAAEDEVLGSSRIEAAGDTRVGVAGLTTHPVYRRYVYASTGELARVERVMNGMIELQTDTAAGTTIDPFRIQHEIGHYVDTAAGAATGTYFAISSSGEWQQFYKAYGEQILSQSAYAAVPQLYNAQECWADAFEMAWSNPAALQAILPELLAYVQAQSLALPAGGITAAAR